VDACVRFCFPSGTTFQDELRKGWRDFLFDLGRRFRGHPNWSRNTWSRSCRLNDNFYATRNSVSFQDRAFVYIPPACARARCGTVDLLSVSTRKTLGQFERTLIIADKGSYDVLPRGVPRRQRTKANCTAAVVEINHRRRTPSEIFDRSELVSR